MYQTPQPIWNEIASQEQLKTPLWRRMFKLPTAQLSGAMEDLESRLEQKGADPRVIRAYLLVAPLLDENLAISRYIEATDRTDLRSSLPEICSENEAMILASQEYRLKPSQQTMLRRLLTTFPTT